MFAWLRSAYRVASAVLATPVMLLLGVPLGQRAWRRLRQRSLSMELLISAGAGSAYLISMVTLLRGGDAVYFDSAVAALVLATFGRFLEAKARTHASKLVAHLLEPAAQPVLAAEPGQPLERIEPPLIRAGMHIEVAVDQPVPVDARASEACELSVAVLSGEAEPVQVAPGDEVPAGAVPLSAPLKAEALRPARESTLERLAELSRGLRARRNRAQRVADRLATWLTPIIALVAVASLAVWWQQAGLARGVEVALSVVLVACPCTYGVITPLIMWLALRKGLQHGVCIRDASVVEALAQGRVVAFDKTGTLTEPLADVELLLEPGVDRADALALLAALERGVPHPLASALHRFAVDQGAEAVDLQGRRMLHSRGVVATLPGPHHDAAQVAVGSTAMMGALGVALPPRDAPLWLARNGQPIASLRLSERLRADASATVQALREQGFAATMLTGDRRDRAAPLAQQLGMDLEAELTPVEKVDALRRLGDRVLLVGDGINDAPASAAAATSFAVAGSTGLNQGVADVLLQRDDLRRVPWTVALSRYALRTAWRTLALATGYNLLFVSLAASGLLRPVWAGVSMLVASLISLASGLGVASFAAPTEQPQPERSPDETSRAASTPAVEAAA
jgi:heavy metal translocating P-type ATPase